MVRVWMERDPIMVLSCTLGAIGTFLPLPQAHRAFCHGRHVARCILLHACAIILRTALHARS